MKDYDMACQIRDVLNLDSSVGHDQAPTIAEGERVQA
ncbi:hypothetical protein Cenrod_2242 [Candidatus Symbiobacter mobilis CR]|uniref:Uncharacterized protein n=1 Tax=Candidatus Symbiobacter mobilis CR TaxID=946483 RepID=U5NA78_9BURK|nr:hypothetical protein Cenrod_2242 [Candidatus Symbiobacter mobilis CR]